MPKRMIWQNTDFDNQDAADNLGCERENLNIQLDEPIIAIADLGLWNGRRSGYKDIESGNVRDCLECPHDYAEIYVDEHGDLCVDDHHHDGTNHILYRVWKSSATDAQRDSLRSKIYAGTATRRDITRVTRRIGDFIGDVYGWTFQRRQPT